MTGPRMPGRYPEGQQTPGERGPENRGPENRGPENRGPGSRIPSSDRHALTVGMRVATALVALILLLLGAGGMLASRVGGDRAGTLPLVAVFVGAFGVLLLLVAIRGRSFGWLPARRPALLPQIVLAVGAVTLVAIGNGIATVRTDAVGRAMGWGSVVLAIGLVIVAVLRRWVPRVGDAREPR